MISIRRKRLSMSKKFTVFLVLTVFLITLCLIKRFSAFTDEWKLQNILENNFHEEKQKIFFVESTFFGIEDAVTLNSRQACSIESAALANPEALVFLIFVTNSNMRNSRILKSLKNYENISIYRLNLRQFAMNTPMEEWIMKETFLENRNLKETISDILRLLLLWR